jgi:hypothetical protein
MKQSPEAAKFLAALDAELAQSAAASGGELSWSAHDLQIRDLIGDALTRKSDLQAVYDKSADNPKLRIALSTELRLLEANVGRLLKQISTEAPQSESRTTQRNRAAANIRWDQERRRNAGIMAVVNDA